MASQHINLNLLFVPPPKFMLVLHGMGEKESQIWDIQACNVANERKGQAQHG